MPPRIGSSARAMSREPFARRGKSVSIREARGRRTSSSSRLPSGLKKALILMSAGMSWAAAGNAVVLNTNLGMAAGDIPTPQRPHYQRLSE
jgi:hypothetical protein